MIQPHRPIRESQYQAIGYDKLNALPHNDNSVEILQFWSEGGYFIVKNNIFPIIPGAVVVVNGVDTHYSNPSNPAKYNRNKLILSMECFEQICTICNLTDFHRTLMQSGGVLFRLPAAHPDTALLDSLFKEAAKCFEDNRSAPNAQAIIISCAIRILAMISRTDLPDETGQADDIVHKMTSYINQQLHTWEDVSLQGLCENLHISASYAAHLFKRLANKSVTQYSNDLRISEAKKMLLTTDLKIQDIAEMLKFKDSTTFCKTFKKYVGTTPRNYRLENR